MLRIRTVCAKSTSQFLLIRDTETHSRRKQLTMKSWLPALQAIASTKYQLSNTKYWGLFKKL